MLRTRPLLLLLLLSLLASFALAQTPADISRRSRERGALNLVGLTAQLELVTTTGDGRTKKQVLSTSSRNIGGRSHALARFSAPAGVAGVAVLTIEGAPGQGDDVAIYLPKLKRVRRVAKSDRGKAFMDTDFAWADIASNGTRDEDLKQLADEQVEGRDCWVLEGASGDEASPYGAVRLFVDKQTFVPMRVDYGDKQGRPLKRYRTLGLKSFKERVLAAESTMENLQTGSKTSLTVLGVEDSALGEDAFTERALER